MGIRDGLVRLGGGQAQERGLPPGWLAQQLELMRFNGSSYLVSNTSYGPNVSTPVTGAAAALVGNGIAYGVFRRRADLFAQGKFRFRRFGNPRPTLADSFSTADLAPLQPERALFEACELAVATAGAAYFVRDGAALRRLPAEHCTIVLGSDRYPDDPAVAWDARKVGLIYAVPGSGVEPETWTWDEVIPYVPESDPQSPWRGMSWMRPAMEDIAADDGARRYLTRFFSNHATPNTAVVFPPDVQREVVEAFRDLFLERHQGVERSFRTAFLGGGADIKVIGSSLKDLDTEAVRQQVHKDIAAAAGVPIVAAGIEQGTYANSKESNRALADGKIRYLWATAAEAFSRAITVPAGSELYVETASISALQADSLDDAQVLAQQAMTMRTLVDGGFVPDSVIAAVTSGDMSKLVHSGLLSVQTQAPGAGTVA